MINYRRNSLVLDHASRDRMAYRVNERCEAPGVQVVMTFNWYQEDNLVQKVNSEPQYLIQGVSCGALSKCLLTFLVSISMFLKMKLD